MRVPEDLNFFSFTENLPLHRGVSPTQKSEDEEEVLPFHTYGESSFMQKYLVTYKDLYTCNKNSISIITKVHCNQA